MKSQGLRPHAYASGPVHSNHHGWLKSFRAHERHDLLKKDLAARNSVFAVMFGAMAGGMVILLISLWMMAG